MILHEDYPEQARLGLDDIGARVVMLGQAMADAFAPKADGMPRPEDDAPAYADAVRDLIDGVELQLQDLRARLKTVQEAAYACAGIRYTTVGPDPDEEIPRLMRTFRYDRQGAFCWEPPYGGPGSDIPRPEDRA